MVKKRWAAGLLAVVGGWALLAAPAGAEAQGVPGGGYAAPAQAGAYAAPPEAYAPAPAPAGAQAWARPGERVLDAGPGGQVAGAPAYQSAPRPGAEALAQAGAAPAAATWSGQAQPAQGGAPVAAPPAEAGSPGAAPAAPGLAPEGGRGAAFQAEDQPLRLRDYEATPGGQAKPEEGGWASQLGGLLFKLLVVLALVGAAFLMVKRSGLAPNLARLGGRGKHLAVMESVALGPHHALHLVSLGARGVALVATGPQGVASLGTFEGGLGVVPAADFAAAYEQAEGEVEAPLRATDALRQFGRAGGRR